MTTAKEKPEVEEPKVEEPIIEAPKQSFYSEQISESGDLERSKYLVYLERSPMKISTRAIVLPNVVTTFGILRDRFGRWQLGQSMEKLQSYKHLKLFKTEEDRRNGRLDDDFIGSYRVHVQSTGAVFDKESERGQFEVGFLSSGAYPQIAPFDSDPYSLSKEVLFYFRDAEKAAQKTNLKTKQKIKAFAKMDQLTCSEQADFLSVMGESVKNLTNDTTYALLAKRIENNPEQFLEMLDNPELTTNRKIISLALEFRIIKRDIQSYYYEEIFLGVGEAEVISTLNNPGNQKVKTSIVEQIKKARVL